MKYNNYYATKKFEEEWAIIEEEYEMAGMSTEAIEEMRAYDWKVKKKDRRFCLHNQYIPQVYDMDDDKTEFMIKYLKSEIEAFENPEEWLQNFEDERLYVAVKELTNRQMLIVIMIYYAGFTKAEVAEKLEISRAAVTSHLKRIKKKIKKFY